MSFEEFTAVGPGGLFRADVPVVITLPHNVQGLGREGIAARLRNMTVTLFTEPGDKNHPGRWQTRDIRLHEFLDDDRYLTNPDTWHRIVSNIRNSPADVDAVVGFDAERFFGYGRSLYAANLWISHRGVFTKNHFDEFENFNIALEGRKRFVIAPPGFGEYYPRSVLRGLGDKSEVFDLDNVDRQRYPRVVPRLAQRRDLILEPGQMLYLPLGWWHQAESLDELNINVNFWLTSRKILRRPHVLGVALCTYAHRKLTRVYSYKPTEVTAR
ncbi:cupin-like domain-containing protein [Micromonospora echinofusca]|uniref:Transcription factor n=1 Tax=Micromonospora echinofusca TaxID=47858 RepID=A0ABS3VRB6_MICEH|nr:cupin-like domain-containing protein [Micromonospora echinofusca]MBO4206944.1 transcription factor [Micromonospora echinofusca]